VPNLLSSSSSILPRLPNKMTLASQSLRFYPNATAECSHSVFLVPKPLTTTLQHSPPFCPNHLFSNFPVLSLFSPTSHFPSIPLLTGLGPKFSSPSSSPSYFVALLPVIHCNIPRHSLIPHILSRLRDINEWKEM